MGDQITILARSEQVHPFLQTVEEFADSEKYCLGFLTRGAIREQASRGRLWVAHQSDVGCAGYLLFGGKFPRLKVVQLFVHPEMRGHQIGSKLITHLEEYGERNSFLGISARVAADLDANEFWRKTGFRIMRQEPGGRSTNRTINVLFRPLKTATLFPTEVPTLEQGIAGLGIRPRPLISYPTYVADLNVFFDVLKSREKYDEACYLFRAALNHEIRIYVTPEFVNELKRHTTPGQRDPVLEFSEKLPKLGAMSTADLQALTTSLRGIVFPGKTLWENSGERAASDLVHLAYCIHHHARCFITRDSAILQAGGELQERYGLEVLTPTDIRETYEAAEVEPNEISASSVEQPVSIRNFDERQREDVESFLLALGLDPRTMQDAWPPESLELGKRRLVARIGARTAGVSSWDHPNLCGRVSIELHVDEQLPGHETVIDHVLETVLRDAKPFTARLISLHSAVEQVETCDTARKRGFIEAKESPAAGLRTFWKFAYNGVITTQNWSDFANDFHRLTDLNLPARMPGAREFENTGIVVDDKLGEKQHVLPLFEFESFVSPALVLCAGRTGIIQPIQKRFADDLLTRAGAQKSLLPFSEAYLRIEKAYFRSPSRSAMFRRGTPVVFYVSGSGGGPQHVIGFARVTYSEVLHKDAIDVALVRQGVLPPKMIKERTIKDKVHVFTFDNFNRFTRFVPYDYLRMKAMISGANLVGPEPLPHEQLVTLCTEGFRSERTA